MIDFENIKSLLELLKVKHCPRNINVIMQVRVYHCHASLKLALHKVNVFVLSCDDIISIDN
jgi:hypothetical protein